MAEAIPHLQRAGYAAISGLLGWLCAQVLCLPVLVLTVVRDSEGEPRLFVLTMFWGMLAWSTWTLLLATIAWVAVVLPIVTIVRPNLLVRYRRWIVALALCFALWLAGRRPAMFRDDASATLFHRFGQVIPYAMFAIGFTVVTAWTYILLSKRRLEKMSADGPQDPAA